LRGYNDGPTVCRRQNVVCGHHQHPCLGLCLNRERYMNRHLVSIEVCVISRANKRMELDGLPVNEMGLKSLDAKAVQRGSPVQENRVFLNNLVKNVPYLRPLFFHNLFCIFNGSCKAFFDKPVIDKGLEKLQGHIFRKPALVESQFRPHYDDRSPGIVDPFPKKILSEPALFTPKHITQRFEGSFTGTGNYPSPLRIVKKSIHCLLEHSFLIPYNDLRRIKLHKPF